MNLLHTLGLMKRSEHDARIDHDEHMISQYRHACDNYNETIGRLTRERSDWQVKHASVADKLSACEAKFKSAATDLAAQAEEIAQMKVDMSRAAEAADNYLNWIAGLEAEVQALRPDAEAKRKKRAADRKRMAGKRNG